MVHLNGGSDATDEMVSRSKVEEPPTDSLEDFRCWIPRRLDIVRHLSAVGHGPRSFSPATESARNLVSRPVRHPNSRSPCRADCIDHRRGRCSMDKVAEGVTVADDGHRPPQ